MTSDQDIRKKAQAKRRELGFEIQSPTHTDSIFASIPIPDISAMHAFAHRCLHGSRFVCTGNENAETLSPAFATVETNDAPQRGEDEADLFVRELLLPSALARILFWEHGQKADQIAQALGLPETIVLDQLSHAILLPFVPEAPIPTPSHSVTTSAQPLDPGQTAAAKITHGPLLLGAGPGTGKTKTLVGRCLYLTQTQGVPPENILALTFSNKAAQEMRERLHSAGVGTETKGPWVGTFHSFGLDLLRRYRERIGLPEPIQLLDTFDAITLLENNFTRLELDILDNLVRPTTHLRGIVSAISRAKDELCTPTRYLELCTEMQVSAQAAADVLKAKTGKILKKDQEAVAKGLADAQKAREVAHCYAVYQELFAEQGYLDYGDLIARAVALLEDHPDVLDEVRLRFPQVLADEYQDVNRGCARMVRLIAGDKADGLWAVGDHRQSIYRFRGASPANVASFGRDYPHGTRQELGVNYRSRQPIVSLFSSVAGAMDNADFVWNAFRGEGANPELSGVTLAVAEDEDSQTDGIADAIRRFCTHGFTLRDQTILCRTHGQAEALVNGLTAQGIPALYLGNILQRTEIKDLLCLLSVFAERTGLGLLRLAKLPEYGVSLQDGLRLIQEAERQNLKFPEALQSPEVWAVVSVNGRKGIERLASQILQLESVRHRPARLLQTYLFTHSDYLQTLQDKTPPFEYTQMLLAIRQLLEIAESYDRRVVKPGAGENAPSHAKNPIRDFLKHLRRLEALGETLRGALPAEAENLDAVRVLTVHAAKGLEFPIVYLPNLAHGQFPSRGRHSGIPEPPGLAEGIDAEEASEEECLFFVGLSRAREHLILSRSERKNGSDKMLLPSPLLGLLETSTPHLACTEWPAKAPEAAEEEFVLVSPSGETLPTFSVSALELYLRCPRQYYYERELKLTGSVDAEGYPQFHQCVRQVVQWMEEEWTVGRTPTQEALAAYLEGVWTANGPVGHLHESRYRELAAQMTETARTMGTLGDKNDLPKSLIAELATCKVQVYPDCLAVDSTGVIVVGRRLLRAAGEDDHTDKRLALYRRAAQSTFPDRATRIELRCLGDGSVREVAANERYEPGRLAKYEKAGLGIREGRFEAQPQSDDECRTCGFSRICPI